MVRSLYSGISGLRNHQVAMDVTGNNISNVNTTGFKSGRVTFEESMSQVLKGASRPPGDAGGTNPMQVGLGMSIGSIDTMLTQGNLQSTGQVTDLALEGRGYFVYSNGEGNVYSRNGALQMDSTGRLVSPTNGFVLQGKMAANDGTYPPGSQIGDLRVPFGEKAPAKATTEVAYSSNLDSESEGLGTIAHTNRFLAVGEDTDRLTSMFDENGNSLGIQVSDRITISALDPNDPSGAEITEDFVVEETTTVDDLLTAIRSVVTSVNPNVEVNMNADGSIDINTQNAGGDQINNLTVCSSRPGSNSYVSDLFSWETQLNSTGGPASDGIYTSAGAIRAPAMADDLMSDVFDASGQPLGLEEAAAPGETGDMININGAVGGDTISQRSIEYTAGMTMGDLLTAVQEAFNLPSTDGTPQNNPSVSLNPASTPDDRLPDGSIVFRGQPETDFALSNISITATNADLDDTAPLRFTSNMGSTEIQTARDTGVHSTSIEVYDESGDAHTMTTTFTHSGTPGEWLWEITMEGGEEILGGNSGRLTFGQDGSPSSFIFNDSATSFRFNPMNGSNEVDISLDVGSPGSFKGITGFRAPSTTAARKQDGYSMGKLDEISVDEYGEVSGIYTNGVSKSIARIHVADFDNPAGLTKLGDSMYGLSSNSGEAVIRRPGVGSPTKIKPGALEMSNVDLASEFTNMITTQRGYQSNARVITTSDNLLQELVQLVR
ncbi:MAG: flagellar hook-basal body complex protein [Chitinispirillaceae bacterium]